MKITMAAWALVTIAFHLAAAGDVKQDIPSDDSPSESLMSPDIVGYRPATSMWDISRIDQDQVTMQEVIYDVETPTAFVGEIYDIQQIYMRGGFSTSYASLNLANTLDQSIPQGTPLVGFTSDGVSVAGQTLDDTPAGSVKLNFQYDVLGDNRTGIVNALSCHMGGLPSDRDLTAGCLDDDNTIEVRGPTSTIKLKYTYGFETNNLNDRTLAKLSTNAKELMYDCPECPYDTYQKFYDYYGEHDYAHQLIMAAYYQDTTEFNLGEADLSNYDQAGRAGT